MVELELALASALKADGGVQGSSCVLVSLAASSPTRADASTTHRSRFDGTPPPHFLGELARTAEGCDILRDSERMDDLVDVVHMHEESALERTYVVELKSVLWAIVRPLPLLVLLCLPGCSPDTANLRNRAILAPARPGSPCSTSTTS